MENAKILIIFPWKTGMLQESRIVIEANSDSSFEGVLSKLNAFFIK
jgi:hypothetical protein